MISQKLFLWFFFLLISLGNNAQHKIYEHFTEKKGLPSNTIYDIAQDEKGYMWFATDNGLCKFDGRSFKTYSIKDGLPDNEILKLYKDSQNRIWLMGFNGEVGYMQHEGFFNQHNTPQLSLLSSKNNLDSAYEDSSGNIWFYGRTSILRCFTKSSQVLEASYSIPTVFPRVFIETGDNEIYLVSNFPKNDLHKVTLLDKHIKVEDISNKKKEQPTFSRDIHTSLGESGFYLKHDSLGMNMYWALNKKFEGFNSFWPPKIYKASPDNSWMISNFTGLHLLSTKEKNITSVFSRKGFLASSYFKDNEGNEWISSLNQGLLFFPKTNIDIVNLEDANDLQEVFQSKDSVRYLGDYNGTLYELDENNKPKYVFPNSLSKFSRGDPNKINHILEYKNFIVLILNSDLRIYERKNGKLSGRYAILNIGGGKKGFIRDDSLLLATSNFVYRIRLDAFIANANWSDSTRLNFSQKEDRISNNLYRTILWKNRSSAILSDHKNRMWIGTNKGLFYIENDSIISFSGTSDFGKCNITDIKETQEGTLLIATNGYGLGVIEKESSYFINEIDGEFNPVINSITIDEKGVIWLATNNGMSSHLLQGSNLALQKKYSTLEGLSSKNIRTVVINKETIYAASPEGLNIIDRKKEDNSTVENVPVYLTSVLINEIPKDSFGSHIFKHSQNDFQFSFTGISYRSLKNIKYAYKLHPWETKLATTASNEIRYSNLPPDDYTFEVSAIDKDGNKSSKPAILSFTISKPWYKTLSFILLIVCLSAFLAWYLISNRIQTIKTRSAYNEKIAVLKHQALLAQMNPHFIYNSLSSIQQFILSQDSDKAQEQLTRFATLIRAILSHSKKTSISLSEEINLIKNYLKLESIRFDNSFSYNLEVDIPETDSLKIPPMIIQPIVENAIIHGIGAMGNSKQGKINISLSNEKGYIKCIVMDNGIGIKASKMLKEKSILNTESLAISNIKERLAILDNNDKNTGISISEQYDENNTVSGTKATIMIPIINYL